MKREKYIDNLKASAIFLVVFVHAGFVYDRSLSFIWIVDDPSKAGLFFPVFLIIDIFVMPLMFFLSGYLSPRSLDRKGPLKYIVSKFKRLYVPWIFAVLILIPLYRVIFLYSRSLPGADLLSYFHFGNKLLSQSWLWFLPVLFVFHLLYVFIGRIKIYLSFRSSLIAAVVIAMLNGFIFDFTGLSGWTKGWFLDFQNERIVLYFLAFLLGAKAWREQVFVRENSKMPAIAVYSCLPFFILLYLLFKMNYLVAGGRNPLYSPLVDGLVINTLFPILSVMMIYSLIGLFRKFFDFTNPILSSLQSNSYGVYIIHMIVTGLLAIVLLPSGLPGWGKLMVLTCITYILSQLVVGLLRNTGKLFSRGC